MRTERIYSMGLAMPIRTKAKFSPEGPAASVFPFYLP